MPSWLSRRAAILVLLVAVGTYANSVLNGFAYDDNIIIVGRLLVTEGRAVEGLTAAYWPEAVSGTGLYRPVTLSSFALEWGLCTLLYRCWCSHSSYRCRPHFLLSSGVRSLPHIRSVVTLNSVGFSLTAF